MPAMDEPLPSPEILREMLAQSNLPGVSEDERKKMSSMFDNPDMVRELQLYMNSMADPATRSEQEEVLRQAESAGEVPAGKELRFPDAWCALECKASADGAKVYVNLTTEVGVEGVRVHPDMRVDLPHVTGPPNMEQDLAAVAAAEKRGGGGGGGKAHGGAGAVDATVPTIEVCFGVATRAMAESSNEMRRLVFETAVEAADGVMAAAQAKAGRAPAPAAAQQVSGRVQLRVLSRDWVVALREGIVSSTGKARVLMLPKAGAGAGAAGVAAKKQPPPPPAPAPAPRAAPPAPVAAQAPAKMPTRVVVGAQPAVRELSCTIVESDAYDMGAAWGGGGGGGAPPRRAVPRELKIVVPVPGVDSIDSLDVDLRERELIVTSRVPVGAPPARLSLRRALPFAVDVDRARCKFVSDRAELRLQCRVLPPREPEPALVIPGALPPPLPRGKSGAPLIQEVAGDEAAEEAPPPPPPAPRPRDASAHNLWVKERVEATRDAPPPAAPAEPAAKKSEAPPRAPAAPAPAAPSAQSAPPAAQAPAVPATQAPAAPAAPAAPPAAPARAAVAPPFTSRQSATSATIFFEIPGLNRESASLEWDGGASAAASRGVVVRFSAAGDAATAQRYERRFDFYGSVVPASPMTRFHISDQNVAFVVAKSPIGLWPSVLASDAPGAAAAAATTASNAKAPAAPAAATSSAKAPAAAPAAAPATAAAVAEEEAEVLELGSDGTFDLRAAATKKKASPPAKAASAAAAAQAKAPAAPAAAPAAAVEAKAAPPKVASKPAVPSSMLFGLD
jgi:hypothetical protein